VGFVSTGAPKVTTWRDTVGQPGAKLKEIEAALEKLHIALSRAGFSRIDCISVDITARDAITARSKERSRRTSCDG
jgi:Xaa-Pro aminopeptidase